MAGVHHDDQPDLARTLAAALAEERPFTVEYRLERRDREYRWVLDHGVPRRSDDGALLGYVGSAVDVTQLRAAQRALLETDLLRSAIFGALHGQVAALDKSGRIIAVNHAWGRFALENGGNPVRVSIGASYLDVCRDAASAGDREAGRILAALRTVLAGGTPLQLEYACRTPTGERWFEMTAEPLRRPEGGALVTHVDITRRRQAEEEAERQREELAHVLRTTTLGELAASLAHEINQPLAAIVANAQATRRLLDAGRASRPGVVETLSDIVDDAKRASQVIRRLRALFRKEQVDRGPVDVNELVEDVVGLLRHDTERQRITVHCALERGLARIPGDSGPAPAGPAQPARQRARGDRDRRGGPARDQDRDGRAREGGRRRLDPGHRDRRQGGGARAHLRALRHQQAGRAGNGSRHQPLDRPGARRPHLGDRQ